MLTCGFVEIVFYVPEMFIHPVSKRPPVEAIKEEIRLGFQLDVWDSSLIRRVETFRRLRYIVSLSGVRFGLPRLALACSVLLVVESWRFLVASAPWCRVDVDAAGVTSPESSCSMSKSPANITESLVIGSPDSAIPVKG